MSAQKKIASLWDTMTTIQGNMDCLKSQVDNVFGEISGIEDEVEKDIKEGYQEGYDDAVREQ